MATIGIPVFLEALEKGCIQEVGGVPCLKMTLDIKIPAKGFLEALLDYRAREAPSSKPPPAPAQLPLQAPPKAPKAASTAPKVPTKSAPAHCEQASKAQPQVKPPPSTPAEAPAAPELPEITWESDISEFQKDNEEYDEVIQSCKFKPTTNTRRLEAEDAGGLEQYQPVWQGNLRILPERTNFKRAWSKPRCSHLPWGPRGIPPRQPSESLGSATPSPEDQQPHDPQPKAGTQECPNQ